MDADAGVSHPVPHKLRRPTSRAAGKCLWTCPECDLEFRGADPDVLAEAVVTHYFTHKPPGAPANTKEAA